MYLTRPEIEATLAVVQRRSAVGSRLIVAYHAPAALLWILGPLLRLVGEPLRSVFTEGGMRDLLGRFGFSVTRDEDVPTIAARISPGDGPCRACHQAPAHRHGGCQVTLSAKRWESPKPRRSSRCLELWAIVAGLISLAEEVNPAGESPEEGCGGDEAGAALLDRVAPQGEGWSRGSDLDQVVDSSLGLSVLARVPLRFGRPLSVFRAADNPRLKPGWKEVDC